MSNDRHLQAAVLAELDWEPSIAAAHIGVMADGGVVTLSGHVTSFAEKQAAEAAARRVKGVKAVVEEIEIRLHSHAKHEDEEIAAAAVHRLAWDVSVPRDAIQVQVEAGWITLTGEVDWHFQRDNAKQAVLRLPGVIGISDKVTIKRKVDVGNISDEIMHALHRSWFFDPKTVRVSAHDGKVVLAGTVRSPHERQIAAATAWAAPGVTDVRNDIMVA
ncbi:ornithine aminotransferase (plasmid) [Sphingomonas panacis]|uniref:Ornithine aminotransferase n=1 Tax=Sphingomonas panacis TaxID=1560345 RepID=A0A1B3ZI00_9SPHN|nr:BON domain-containing protein [Sphingomonas panacis]AOH87057.1 ornithine aminotransferase [Sphingomonas panacis]